MGIFRVFRGKSRRDFSAAKTCWRRERDSNPRYLFRYSGFQDRLIKPLSHPSAKADPGIKPDIVYNTFLTKKSGCDELETKRGNALAAFAPNLSSAHQFMLFWARPKARDSNSITSTKCERKYEMLWSPG